MNKYAVLIGNNQFPDETDKSKLPDLACPEKDVDGLAKVLASERGEFTVFSLKNESNLEVLDKLQDVVNQARKDDLLLIYYSGHGKPNKAGILHLTTVNTVVNKLESRAISINRVYEILDTAKCKKIVIILDCCYSGAAGQGFKGGAVDDQLQQLNNARGTYLVTASTEVQVAHESAAEGLSLFTKHLIADLETGEADKDGDGWVSMNELFDYVQNHVVAENPAQQPTRHIKDDRGSLFIIKSGKDSETERLKKIKNYFYDLSKEEKITHDILTKVLELLKSSLSDFSPLEQQQYILAVELFENKILAIEFVRKWDRLTFEIEKSQEKAEQERLASEKTVREKAEQEKAMQEKLTKEKATQEKIEFDKKLKLEQERLQFEENAKEKQEQIKIELLKKLKKYSALLLFPVAGVVLYPNIKQKLEAPKKLETPKPNPEVAINRYQLKDGLVSDTTTKLIWMRCSLGQTWDGSTCQKTAKEYTWDEAMKVAKNFKYAGYNDWRIPTHEELLSLVYCSSGKPKEWLDTGSLCQDDYSRPTILTAAFPNTPDDWFWSSSPIADVRYDAWIVNFDYGADMWGSKGSDDFVRLVRGGQ